MSYLPAMIIVTASPLSQSRSRSRLLFSMEALISQDDTYCSVSRRLFEVTPLLTSGLSGSV